MASLTPEPAQHFSALLGRGYDGEGDCALNALPPSFPAATTTPTTATTETTLGLETKATTKTLGVEDCHTDHTDDYPVYTNTAER